jgi:soluble cytochrome b562
MTESIAQIRRALADVDKQVEPIARNHPEDSDVSTLADAIRRLVGGIDDLAAHVEAGGRGRRS